ncbi:MAG: MlaD family protein [Betaproteobacteria bacterium]
MSLKANYFKLGLFVIGSIIAGVMLLVVIGSGRWFQPKLTVESYFNESVQGLDVGSKLKYRGVAIGEVTKIGFTYNRYQLDRPMAQRERFVLVEAQIEPKLLGGRVATGDWTNEETAKLEVERGLRMRLAPQGITGTSYLEIDYVDPPPLLLRIDWKPDNVYIPSAPSTVSSFVNAAQEILDRLHKLDIEGTLSNLNKLMTTSNERIGALDTKALSERTVRVLGKVEATLDSIAARKLSDEGVALLTELRATNAELKKMLDNPSLRKLPDDASAAIARIKELVSDPKLAKTLSNLERATTRLDRIVGGGETDLTSTIENLRQITDNLRDLTEDTKRYPASVLFGGPPPPLERKP